MNKREKLLHALKEQWTKLTIKLKAAERQLEIAGNRWQSNHDKAHAEHKAAKEAERAADKAHRQNHPKLATREEGRASRRHYRANKAHLRAEYWVKRAKDYAAKVGHLKDATGDRDKEIDKIEKELGPRWDGNNKIVGGGSERDKLKLFMQLSMKHGSRFYSQSGPADVFHGITGPSGGHRHDCSSWFTSGYCSCGLRDPNSTADDRTFSNTQTMFTGTLGEHGQAISEGQLNTGDAILYGSAPFHHVEMKYGSIKETRLTVGHGNAEINYGTVSLLPGPRSYRRFV